MRLHFPDTFTSGNSLVFQAYDKEKTFSFSFLKNMENLVDLEVRIFEFQLKKENLLLDDLLTNCRPSLKNLVIEIFFYIFVYLTSLPAERI